MEFRNGYGDVSVREWLLRMNDDDFPTPKKCVHVERKNENCELLSSPFFNREGTNVKNIIKKIVSQNKMTWIYLFFSCIYLLKKINLNHWPF